MPRTGRGGARQGTPGKGYSNRTDLASNMAPGSAAAGGLPAPPAPSAPVGPQNAPMMGAPMLGTDEVPNLSDPTMRPDEDVMAGTPMGRGPGIEALGPLPPNPMDPVRMATQALFAISPNPDLARILARLDFEGR